MKRAVQETVVLVVMFSPLLLMAFTWNQIPETIPMHYNVRGEVDDYGSKTTLAWVIAGLQTFLYFLFMLVPALDPKKRFNATDSGYQTIRLLGGGLVAAIFLLQVMSLQGLSVFPGGLSYALLFFMIVMGNVLPTIKQNYFVGVRTPWTLENQEVWRKTHRMTGRLWVASGLIGLIINLWVGNLPILAAPLLLGATGLMSVIYSYIIFQKSTQST